MVVMTAVDEADDSIVDLPVGAKAMELVKEREERG